MDFDHLRFAWAWNVLVKVHKEYVVEQSFDQQHLFAVDYQYVSDNNDYMHKMYHGIVHLKNNNDCHYVVIAKRIFDKNNWKYYS